MPDFRSYAPQGRHRPLPSQTVLYGMPLDQSLDQALSLLDADRVAVVTTRSLSAQATLLHAVQEALGSRWVTTLSHARALSPREDVIRIANGLGESKAQAVIAFGGSSVCDTVKAARLCLGNHVTQAADIDRLRLGRKVQAPALQSVMLPTTLSAAEYTPFAGVVDESVPRHEALHHESLPPAVVILDADLTEATPRRLWLSTGMRAVDHAVETWCAVDSTPFSDASSLHALRLLHPALQAYAAAPQDRQARLDGLVGAWLSIQGFAAGVSLGASHGIGHALAGTAGMPHGETSCVMLPHVLKFNSGVNADRQRALCEAMGTRGGDAGDLIHRLVATIGLPTRLRDANVDAARLPQVAGEAMKDRCVKRNPRAFVDVDQMLGLLQQAW